jgi:feruloyl esterase
VQACDRTFRVESLRCPSAAASADTCLSETQIETLKTAASPFRFAFPLAHGIRQIGPYPVLRGADVTGTWLDTTGNRAATSYAYLADPVIRYFIEQDPNGSTVNFDYRTYEKRVEQLSLLYDATDPDIDRFAGHGGKLIMVQGTTDMLVAQDATNALYDQMAKRYGGSISRFVRYYVQPGFGHGTGNFDLAWDSLTALDNWASRQTPPSHPVATDATPANGGRTRPLCEYPLWPRYKGHGDIDQAQNYTCAGHGRS